jgi:predicted  nucleic acid-binding Zn-ribbon protein
MGIRDTCPRCGRGGSGKQNIITRQDIETQQVYLDQRGYFFRNPYWNVTSSPKILPEPYLYEDIMGSDLRFKSKETWGGEHTDKEKELLKQLETQIGLAIKERRKKDEEDLKKKYVALRQDHYIPGDIHKKTEPIKFGFLKKHECGRLILYEFRYRWIYTNKILTYLPYGMREFLKESTFFLKPMNEQEFSPHELTTRWEPRLKNCGYEVNDKIKWEKLPDDLWFEIHKTKNKETPSQEVIDNFLIEPCYRIWEWREQYITPEDSRTCYTQDYVDELKEFLKDFSPDGKWGKDYTWLINPPGSNLPSQQLADEYYQMRVLIYVWGHVWARHIEGRLDQTREGYVCYLPSAFTTFSRAFDRVNDERLIFSMIEDQVASWYPRLFDVDGVVWQFVTRPMTKQMFEEFNEITKDGQVIKMPVESCVFCPGGRGMSASTNDDEPIVPIQTLVGNHESDGNSDEWKQKKAGWEKRMNEFAKLSNVEDLAEVINNAVNDPKVVKKFGDAELERLQEYAKKIKEGDYSGTQGLSGGTVESLDEVNDILTTELDRRADLRAELEERKDFAQQQREEFQNQITDHNNLIGQRIESMQEVTAEIKKKQHEKNTVRKEMRNTKTEISKVAKNVRDAEREVGRLRGEVAVARTEASSAAGRAEENILRQKAEKLEGELRVAEANLIKLEGNLTTLRGNVEKNEDDIKRLEEEIEGEKEKLKKAQDDIDKSNINVGILGGRINTADNEIKKNKEKLREMPNEGGNGGGGGDPNKGRFVVQVKLEGDIMIMFSIGSGGSRSSYTSTIHSAQEAERYASKPHELLNKTLPSSIFPLGDNMSHRNSLAQQIKMGIEDCLRIFRSKGKLKATLEISARSELQVAESLLNPIRLIGRNPKFNYYFSYKIKEGSF